MIIVGDTHFKNNEIFFRAQKKFLKWLLKNYKDETIIQLGDLWDNSSPHNSIEDEVISYLKQFKDFRVIYGNHDQSKIKGGALSHLRHHSNITVYENMTEVVIENHSCLMLPYKYNMSDYEELVGEYDFIFTHSTPKEESFGGEYTDLSKLKGVKIYGHIHLCRKYPDAYILGVPVITRNGESNNPIIEIDSKKNIIEIKPPVFFDILDINYGDEIENKDYLYNIKKAPSIKSVYQMYPVLNIRDSGIEVVFSSNEDQDIMLSKLDGDLKKLFYLFCHEREIDKAYEKEGLTAISEFVEGV